MHAPPPTILHRGSTIPLNVEASGTVQWSEPPDTLSLSSDTSAGFIAVTRGVATRSDWGSWAPPGSPDTLFGTPGFAGSNISPMVPALPDFALASSYASLPVAGPALKFLWRRPPVTSAFVLPEASQYAYLSHITSCTASTYRRP